MKGRNKTILPVLVQYKNTPYYASKDGRIFRLRDEGYVEMSQVLIPTGRYKFVKTSVNGNVKKLQRPYHYSTLLYRRKA